MSVSRTQAKGLLLAVVCAAVLAGAGMSAAATPKKPPLAAPVNCGKLISASLAESLTRLGITAVTASTKKVKDGWVSSCRYHAATDDGTRPRGAEAHPGGAGGPEVVGAAVARMAR